MSNLPKRKKTRLEGYDYSLPGVYFVTICTQNKAKLFGDVVVLRVQDNTIIPTHPQMILSTLGRHVEAAIIYYIENSITKIDKYVIMPNHIHMIIDTTKAGDRGRSLLPHIVRSLKSYVTKKAGASLWQKSFHDRVISSDAEYQKIWQYIDENPQRWNEDCYYTE